MSKTAQEWVQVIRNLTRWKPEHGDDTYVATAKEYENIVQSAMAQAWDEGRKATDKAGVDLLSEMATRAEAYVFTRVVSAIPNPYKGE